MATFIKGEVLILDVWDGAAYRPVACLTSNSLSKTREVIETQTKCDPGLTVRGYGSLSYEISLEGNYIDTTSVGGDTAKASHDYLDSLMEAGTDVDWRMATGLADTAYYYGTAIITDLTVDAAAGNEWATFSSTFSGSGAIVTTDPNA